MIYATQQSKGARHIAQKRGLVMDLRLQQAGGSGLKTPEHMMEVIAGALNMSASCYSMRSREREIVELRFLASMFMRTHFPYTTLQQIAALFGGLNHSSVINGLARAYDLIYTGDSLFISKYNAARKAVDAWMDETRTIAA
jgi:chromosomal replication initiation ATPase DnaA